MSDNRMKRLPKKVLHAVLNAASSYHWTHHEGPIIKGSMICDCELAKAIQRVHLAIYKRAQRRVRKASR